MRSVTLALLTAAALTSSAANAAPAAAQTPQGARTTLAHHGPTHSRNRLQRTVDPAIFAALAPALDSAEVRGLPLDPLVDKALYGAMRREPVARIRAALAALAQRLQTAQEALAPAPTPMEIAAGADALAVGVPRETLRTIRTAARSRSVAVPLGVLTELVVQRVPIERASSMVIALLQKGATPAQLVALGAEVRRDIHEGIAPDAALDLRTRGVFATLPGGAPSGINATEVRPGFTGPTSTKP